MAVRTTGALCLLSLACGRGDGPVVAPVEPTPAHDEVVAERMGPAVHPLGTLKERDATQRAWLKLRLERVLPELMRKHGVDMWIVISREYNEDPVFFSLVPPTRMAARRRTILVFFDRGPEAGIERLALGGGSSGGLYTVYRDPEIENRELMGDAQWSLLRKLVREREPAKIAIDTSETHAFADGLSSSEQGRLEKALGRSLSRKLVPAGALAVEYVSVRLPQMLPTYERMMEIVHGIIARAFSSEVITPGQTTTEDVQWYMREQVRGLGLGEWFPPSVDVQRQGQKPESYLAEDGSAVIEHGDVLHCDFGLVALGLATDTQHLGYVLRPGETSVPPGLQTALERGNRLQDILMSHMKPGRTGNEILELALAQMKQEGIEGTIYTHPVGDHGHGAGPLIGLWDRQEGVPGRGDLPLLPDTWFSIELQATTPVPEWGGQRVRAALEEDAVVDAEGKARFVRMRQTKFHLVR